jgi:PTS system mannose-specific IIA component
MEISLKQQATDIGVLVVTHGRLADELVAAAGVIVGATEHIRALSIGWNDDVDEARETVKKAIESADRGRGVLVLTDMFGGTPTNLSLSFLAPGSVEIITGVNLPMVVKTSNLAKEIAGGLTLRQVAEKVATKGRESVIVAGDMLEPEGGKA